MSLSHAPAFPSPHRSGRFTVSTTTLGNAVLGILVFLGGFVFFEPAPYELLILPVMVVWFAFGLSLHRAFLPLTFFLLCFICGGAIAATQRTDVGASFYYIVVTGFLATTAIFFAALVAARPQERLSVIFRAYTVTAIIGALIGILAYFRLLPNSDLFLFAERARGPFQDPNVFGPFMVLPTIFLLRHILINPIRKSGWSILGILILFAAIFLAFSRAAWGLTILACVLTTAVVFINAHDTRLRSKILAVAIMMAAAALVLIVAVLSIDAVSALFAERAKLVQSYDGARFGRFARYTYGLEWIMEGPLGYGFGKFRETFGEDTHNIYIKAFIVYGWLGGLSYLILLGTTLGTGFRHLFRASPWQGYFQCCYIVILGHALVGLIVDIDRWRHLYLIYGMAWGMIAADAARRKWLKTHAAAPRLNA